jgi:hypothetical protein
MTEADRLKFDAELEEATVDHYRWMVRELREKRLVSQWVRERGRLVQRGAASWEFEGSDKRHLDKLFALYPSTAEGNAALRRALDRLPRREEER